MYQVNKLIEWNEWTSVYDDSEKVALFEDYFEAVIYCERHAADPLNWKFEFTIKMAIKVLADEFIAEHGVDWCRAAQKGEMSREWLLSRKIDNWNVTSAVDKAIRGKLDVE